jgi:hypothetical protein
MRAGRCKRRKGKKLMDVEKNFTSTVDREKNDPICFGRSETQKITRSRGGVSSTRGLGPTMTARDHSIGISIGMLPQTAIVSRVDQLSRLGVRI